MVSRAAYVLSFVLMFACALAWSDDREAAPTKQMSLERAVLDFNEDSDADREKLGLLRLTEMEVLAAIHSTIGMKYEDYKLFKEIAETKKLPANAKLVLYRRSFANGYKTAVWKIELSIKKSDKEYAQIEVRNQYLSTERDIPQLNAMKSSK